MKQANLSPFKRASLIACATLCSITYVHAQSGTWTGPSGGNWSDIANWNSGAGPVADGAGNTANFSSLDIPAGTYTVNLVSPRTIGNLTFGDIDSALTPGTWTLAGANTLTLAGTTPTITTGVGTTISSVIGGTAGLVKTGTEGLDLTAANAYTGAVTVNAGDLRFSNSNIYAGGTTINLGASVTLGVGGSYSTGGIGTGTITFNGGSLNSTHSNNNTLVVASPILVPAGQTGTFNATNRFEMTGAVSGAGTFIVNFNTNTSRADFRNDFSGFTGNLDLAGTGGVRLRINQSGSSFNGAGLVNTQLNLGPNASVQAVTNSGGNDIPVGSLSGSGNFSGGSAGSARYQVGGLEIPTTFAGAFQGNSQLIKVGLETLTLTGESTNTQPTLVNAGTLSIGDGGATGSLGSSNVTLAADTAIIFNRDSTAVSAYPGILSGSGSVTKKGTGRVNFTGANTYTSGTLIEGGIIGINSDASLGDLSGPVDFFTSDGGIMSIAPSVASARTFIIDGITASFGAATTADSLQIDSAIDGSGSVTINGDGITIFAADNVYTGSTTITSGTLVAANISGSATSSGSVTMTGGSLAGDGAISGNVSASAGSQLRPGDLSVAGSFVGSLAVGGLGLDGGSVINVEFQSASVYDTIEVTGVNGLTSSGNSGDPVLVDLRVENSVGKWLLPGTYNLISFQGTFAGDPDDIFEVTPDSQQPGLTYAFSVSGNFIQLEVIGADPSIWNVDAPGNWTNVGNWLNGVPNAAGVIAQFSDAITADRVVTLDANQTAAILQFNNANRYTIAGTSTLTLDQAGGDTGIEVLAGDHTIQAPASLADPLVIGILNATDSLELLGVVSGSSGISKNSPGDLVLGGDNTFSGDLVFSDGMLTFASGGLGQGDLVLDGANLVWAPGNTQDITDRNITFGDNPITFTMQDPVTLANDFGFDGIADLTKAGAGTLTLTTDVYMNGNIIVQGGALSLGNGGAAGTVFGSINLADPATKLIINRSDDGFFSNVISGPGSLEHAGSGNTLISGVNTFTGQTTIAAGGSLILGNGLSLQGSTLVYTDAGGALDISGLADLTLGGLTGDRDIVLENGSAQPIPLTVGGNGSTTTYSGSLGGTGSFVKVGTGVLTVTGAHTYTGGTAANTGTLVFGPGSSVAATTWANADAAGRLEINGGDVTSTATSTINSGGANGLHVLGGSIAYDAGVQSSNNDASLISIDGGSFSASTVNLRRTQNYNAGADPSPAVAGNNGLVVNSGDATITGALNIGTSNSGASALVNGGELTVGGVTNIGNTTNTRWSMLEIRSGTFTSTDTVGGVVISPSNAAVDPAANKGLFLISGGSAIVERIAFGTPTSVGGTNAIARVAMTSGELYIGAGGIVQDTPDITSQIFLSGGVLGAKADWSTSLPVTLTGSVLMQAADLNFDPFDITLSGAVSGDGSIVKEGGGKLTLAGAYSYTGNTTIFDGTLTLNTANLSNTGYVDILPGAVLDLAHGQQDIVGEFSIDGTPLGEGVYDKFTHPGLITGDGSLRVLGSDPFAAWIAGFTFEPGADITKTGDPDNDGMNNLQEFAFDGNPSSGAASGKIRSRVENVAGEQALVLTLPVRGGVSTVFSGAPGKSSTTVDGIIYHVTGSNNLMAFDQAVTEITPDAGTMPAPTDGWTYRAFRLDGAVGGVTPRGPKGFLRAGVEDTLAP